MNELIQNNKTLKGAVKEGFKNEMNETAVQFSKPSSNIRSKTYSSVVTEIAKLQFSTKIFDHQNPANI